MFLDMSFRSLFRHKTRTFLTGLGIVLAIAAIVSLGSISEGINGLVTQQLKFASNFISVTEKGAMDFNSGSMPGISSRVPREVVDEIAQIDGVNRVIPQIRTIDPTSNLFVIGIPLEDKDFFDVQNIGFRDGDWPNPGEKALVIGYQLAESKRLAVGDDIKVKGDTYTISGVLEQMSNFIDYAALTSIEAVTDTFDFGDYYSAIVVDPSDVSDSKRIADEIDEQYDSLEAITADEALKRAEVAIDQVRLMTLGIGIVASLVASIGIINTMLIVVIERKGEFGIMKALGAETRVIMMIVLQEAALIGFAGSAIGLSIGYFGTEAINKASAFPIASVTPNLALISLAYGVLLSVLAALYPAYQAVKVDPAESMRAQES